MGTPKSARLVVGLVAGLLLVTGLPAQPAAASDAPWLKPGAPYPYAGDPSVTALGSMLFTYGTNQGGADLPVTWSADASTWTARPEYEGAEGQQDGDPYGYFNDAFPTVPWGVDYNPCDGRTPGCDPKELWAPSVGFVGSEWVGYHAVMTGLPSASLPYGRFAIYTSHAASPIGPFSATSSQPLINTSTSTDPAGAIDPDVFVDETSGRAYLLWKTEGNRSGNFPAIWSRALDPSGLHFAPGSVAHRLLTVSQQWEGEVVENPSLTKVNGRYVLLFSGNRHDTDQYAVGYATCTSPLGGCTASSSNPILTSAAGSYGPGGADGLVDSRGRFIMTYHARSRPNDPGDPRRDHVAELTISPSFRVVRRDLAGGAGPDSVWSSRPGGSYTSSPASITRTLVPAAADFNGDHRDDIAWYGTWDQADTMWYGTARSGAFTAASFDQRGAFVPLAGDFNADGRSDLYWYQPGADPRIADPNLSGPNYDANARPDELWLSTPGGWAKSGLSMPWAALPLVGDFNGDGASDILWSQPGGASDRIWFFNRAGAPTDKAISINGNYRPVVGDFDGNGVDDIFWYGPGARADSVWWFTGQGTYSSEGRNVSGEQYRPFAGDFDGDGHDDLFWYAPGPGQDYRWSKIARGGSSTSTSVTASGIYQPVVGDYDANGVDDIVWYS